MNENNEVTSKREQFIQLLSQLYELRQSGVLEMLQSSVGLLDECSREIEAKNEKIRLVLTPPFDRKEEKQLAEEVERVQKYLPDISVIGTDLAALQQQLSQIIGTLNEILPVDGSSDDEGGNAEATENDIEDFRTVQQ